MLDLGPESGDRGGKLVAWGPPEEVPRSKQSRSAKYLAEEIERRAPAKGRGRKR